jgi:hypothetical protein
MKRLLTMAMTAMLLNTGAAWAGPLGDAGPALVREDYVTALSKYRSLARGVTASHNPCYVQCIAKD